MKNCLLLLLFFTLDCGAQDSLPSKQTVVLRLSRRIEVPPFKWVSPTPSKATLLALIPGMGQVYNRDYWKLPIVYISLLGSSYSWHLNNLKYQDFLTGYKQFYDMNPVSASYGQAIPELVGAEVPVTVRNLFNTKSEKLNLNRDVIARNKDYWRRNRNLSIIVTGLVYSLSIIEANVAAHLKGFDISDDLSLHIEPKLSQPEVRQVTPGVRLVVNLK